MKRILRSRLPERLADRVPPLFVEVATALVITGLMVLLRIAIVPWTGDRAPFAFVFIAGTGATVLAGWRSGTLAVLFGQLLIWFFVIEPMISFRIADPTRLYALILATLAELAVVWIIALYQREVERAWSRREAQVELIRQALAEIDHRTANNYQTVLALVLAQAKRADGPVQEALQQVADRINAIAMASKQLALGSESLEEVRVTHHLGELCAQIKKGLSRPGVNVTCQFDDVWLGAEEAIAISILVNELVTNSLKHAFPEDRPGEIRVTLGKSANGMLLEIADDGIGMEGGTGNRGSGLGMRLVETFTRQLGARHEIETSDGGTCHRIHLRYTA